MIILSSGARALLEVISLRAINWTPNILVDQKQLSVYISFDKCGIAMASNGNINRGIQLIIEVIDCKMLVKRKIFGRYVICTSYETK